MTSGSNLTVAVCATGLAATDRTPGRRPSTASTTFFSDARNMPETSSTAVAVNRPCSSTPIACLHTSAAGRAAGYRSGRRR